MMRNIRALKTRNSRGEAAIKIILETDSGIYSASSPSGKSKSGYEAKTENVDKILKIFPKLKNKIEGMEESYKAIDKIMQKFPGNLSTAVSIAVLRAEAKNKIYKFLDPKAKAFPYPLGNVIGGGAHGGRTDMQEFLLMPFRAKTIREAIDTNLSIWNRVGSVLKDKNVLLGRNDENAWTSNLNDIETLELLLNVSEEYEVKLGIDFAASQICKNGFYCYKYPENSLSSGEQIDFVKNLIETYKLAYVEDPFHEEDFESFAELTRKVKCIIAGDDIFATTPERLKLGIKEKACNAVIIKPNQAGTVSRTLETARIAERAGYVNVVSHRSGETEDDFIADLAVGISAPLIKCGIYGKERAAKLDRLIKIWNEIENPKMAKLNI